MPVNYVGFFYMLESKSDLNNHNYLYLEHYIKLASLLLIFMSSVCEVYFWSLSIMIIKSLKTVGFSLALAISLPVNAALMGMWEADGWELLDAEDGVGLNGYVGPGYGGQIFDAEYLFYKQDKVNMTLSIGIQTGFDLIDGRQMDGWVEYFAGDLALGFNGGDYEYAVDFGFLTKDYDGDNVGLGNGNQDKAGLYKVSEWNNDILYNESSPFAMDEGTFLSEIETSAGKEGDSYYRVATIDLDSLGFDVTDFSTHWTMSCGNDVVESVPEPSPSLLLLGGLLALIGGRKIKNAAKA
jgi:hypothetical protein